MIKAKKSLGQNFLKSKQIIDKIIETADLKSKDIVLEIGPGKGILTEKLLEKSKKVIAIEKDHRLIEFLQEKFKQEIENNHLTLIYNDILEIDPRTLIKAPYKIVANIPYYITGQFLRKFLSSNFQPTKIVVMLQKEVAKRITTSDKKESILSLSVKTYGKPKYITTVKAINFSPTPKIDSAILSIDEISKNLLKNTDEKVFFRLIKKGFSSKRKMLINNLSFIDKNKLKETLDKLGIPIKVRAEDLSLQNWISLTNHLKK